MTSHNPFSDPLFIRLLWPIVLAFLFLTCGALVREWRRRRHPQERPLLVPVATAAVLTFFFLLALFAGGPWLTAAAGLLTFQACLEYARLTALHRRYVRVLTACSLGSLLIVMFFPAVPLAVLPIGMFLALTLIPILSGQVGGSHAQVCTALFGYLFIGLPMVYLLFVRAVVPWGLQLLLITGVCGWLSDSCGYIVGSKVKGPRLAPTVSPGKTWSGAAGSIAGAVAGVTALRALVPLHWTMVQLAPLALLVAACAIWGDLIESTVKRSSGVKDAGTVLPGFGGVLDRFDSLLVSVPAAYYAALGLGYLAH